MKKIFCLTSVFILISFFSSCSNNDDNGVAPPSIVTFKIDGIEKSFPVIVISESQEFEQGNENYILVSAGATASSTEFVRFTLPVNQAGTQQTFRYENNYIEYSNSINNGVELIVTSHTGSRITGTFSGLVSNQPLPPQQASLKTITEGTFSINY